MTASAALDSIRICNDCLAPGDDQWVAGYAGSGATCTRCDRYQEDVLVYLPDANEPRLHMEAGARAVEFSTCLDLDRRIIWDSNGYYRHLGIPTDATKRQIREAYQAMGGDADPFATYAVKQLLNDQTRAAYDAVPLGGTFFDHYVAAYVRRQAAHDIAMSNMTGTSDGTPIELDLDHLLNKPFQMVDNGDRGGQSALSHPRRTTSAWGYYRWQSKSTDTGKLAVWRGLIAAALRARGVTTKLAVGFTAGTAPEVARKRIGFRTVVFLNDRLQPTEANASRVVSIIPTNTESR